MESINLTWFIPILIVFLGVMAFLAWLGYKQTKSAKDYLVAGGNVNPYMMALSYGAAFISTAAIVGFGGLSGKFGLHLMWVVFLNIAIGIVVAYLVFGKRMRQMGRNLGTSTFSEFLGKRFDSRFSQWFSAGVIFIFMPLYAAAVMRGAAEFMTPIFNVGIEWLALIYIVIVAVYVIFGGLKGVIYSDSFLGSVMLVSMVILVAFVYQQLGGISSAHSQLTDLVSKVPTDQLMLNAEKGISMFDLGFKGWTAFPVFNSEFWWLSVSTLMMGIGVGVLAQPQLLVRFMTVRKNKDLNRALLVGGIFILIVVGGAYVAGALSNVFFFNETGTIAVKSVPGGNIDLIIPTFIKTYMSPAFLYIFFLTLMAAGISTSAAQFHTIGTALGKDIYEDNVAHTNPEASKNSLVWKRVGIAVAIIFTYVLGILILPKGIVGIGTAFFFSIAAATFLPAVIGGLFWRRTTKQAANWSMILGLFSSILWSVLFNAKVSGAFGITPVFNYAPWTYIEPGAIGLVISILTLFIVSMATKPPPKEHVETCFSKAEAQND
ncbi:MAG TPA: sodium:solute symporter family protein [Caldisericia bacterium]|nr:sodium:solute symporter family protein [Caldisericia bacterium]HPF48998.1 sodium:solute symporter family protein [Caldisericia bacterium]HPI83138.1 sodium:solute symporter family protein [Caldisericia bacterium]HPQ92365.1 sodium:solute symporter family protein [Caldisericia bacterium]HRV74537.1 sodium:solute symporter family protein [Caldisericia bacterium]